jgi:hypothetical protein
MTISFNSTDFTGADTLRADDALVFRIGRGPPMRNEPSVSSNIGFSHWEILHKKRGLLICLDEKNSTDLNGRFSIAMFDDRRLCPVPMPPRHFIWVNYNDLTATSLE